MGSAPVKTGVKEQCPERERLLREWTQCGRRLAKLLDDQLAAMKSSAPSFASFEEQILLARSAETEACRKYFGREPARLRVNLGGVGAEQGSKP
jgi:hypothetical protein